MSTRILVSLAVGALVLSACTTAPPVPTGTAAPTGGPTAGPTGAPTGGRLATIQARGSLICGVNTNLPGFGFPEEGTGRWLGFDADFCRVVATAVFGDPEKVEFRPLSADDRGP